MPKRTVTVKARNLAEAFAAAAIELDRRAEKSGVDGSPPGGYDFEVLEVV